MDSSIHYGIRVSATSLILRRAGHHAEISNDSYSDDLLGSNLYYVTLHNIRVI